MGECEFHWLTRGGGELGGSLSLVIQLLCRVRPFVTPRTAARQASLSFTTSQSLLTFMAIESLMLSNHLILYRPLLFLLSIFPSIRVFSSWRENQLLRAGPIGHHKSHRFSQQGTYRTLCLPTYPNRILEIFQDHWIIVHSFSSFGLRRHFLMLLFYL